MNSKFWVTFVIALILLCSCEAIRPNKYGTKYLSNQVRWQLEGKDVRSVTETDGNKHDKDEKHDKQGHHEDSWHHGHHGKDHWKMFANMTMQFVDRNLPANTYVVLQDKGIQVRALYEACGDRTVVTKVAIQASDKMIVVSANGKIKVDEDETDISRLQTLKLANDVVKITTKHDRFLRVEYGVYNVFSFVDEHDECPHVGLSVAVDKNAKVSAKGFVGLRLSVNPTDFVTDSI